MQWVREVAAVKGKENWSKLTVAERKRSLLSLRRRKDGPKVSLLCVIAEYALVFPAWYGKLLSKGSCDCIIVQVQFKNSLKKIFCSSCSWLKWSNMLYKPSPNVKLRT